MVKKFINPYFDHKSSDNAGTTHYSGIPAKIGLRMGTFTEDSLKYRKMKKSKPPRKFN